MHRLVPAALTIGLLLAARPLLRSQPDRAGEILTRAREAIGGEARLKAVRSLSLSGDATLELASADGITSAARFGGATDYKVEVEIVLPDKYLVTSHRGVWSDGINGNEIIARRDGVQVTFDNARARQAFTEMRQREFLRYVLAWLLEAPDQSGVRFADGGVGEFEGTRADIVEATGPYRFAARLVFDGQARLLILEDFVPTAPPVPAKPLSPPEKSAAKDDRPLFSAIEMLPDQRDIRIRVADYRLVDGIRFPHRIVTESHGFRREEFRISQIKVNPQINPKHFNPK